MIKSTCTGKLVLATATTIQSNTYRLMDSALRIVLESSPSVFVANLSANMNTAFARSMAHRLKSWRAIMSRNHGHK